MKDVFLKIWKDPVWSKVISAGILYILVKFIGWLNGFGFIQTLMFLHEIGVSYVAALIFIILIYRWIHTYRKYRLRKELMKFNSQEDLGSGLLAKWDIMFDDFDKPFIANLCIAPTTEDP